MVKYLRYYISRRQAFQNSCTAEVENWSSSTQVLKWRYILCPMNLKAKAWFRHTTIHKTFPTSNIKFTYRNIWDFHTLGELDIWSGSTCRLHWNNISSHLPSITIYSTVSFTEEVILNTYHRGILSQYTIPQKS
jgi:hypothetical protein